MIGVDIINIYQLPNFCSKLEKRFFYDNFSKKELCYIKKTYNKQYYLAVIFSLKESILKCDNSYIDVPFKKINIIIKDSLAYHKKFSLAYSSLKGDLVVTSAMFKNY